MILQVFDWNSAKNYKNTFYKNLLELIGDIKDAGFTAVLMPPPWRETLPEWDGEGKNEVGYLWIDFDKNSAYGTNEDLKNLASELKNTDIKVIYDLVINHRDTTHVGKPGLSSPWCAISLRDQRMGSAVKRKMGLETYEPHDLDLNNEKVFEAFVTEIINLILNYSAQGFRLDKAKGYPPETVNKLMEAVRDRLVELDQTVPELFLVAEYWSSDNKRGLISWSKKSSCKMFDFPLQQQFHLGEFCNSNMRQGLNTHANEKRRRTSVTFIENHDTGYSEEIPHTVKFSQAINPVDDKLRKSALLYLLLSPGIPCVFWPHWEIWGKIDGSQVLINSLIDIRKKLEINACSQISFDQAVSTEGILATIIGSQGIITIGIGFNIEKHFEELKDGKTYFAENCGFIHFHNFTQGEKIMQNKSHFTGDNKTTLRIPQSP